MSRSKRILSYETPPARRPPAEDDADDAPHGAAVGMDAISGAAVGVCVVTVACVAGVFAMGPVSDFDPPAWVMLQNALVVTGAAGMLVAPVICLLAGGSRRR